MSIAMEKPANVNSNGAFFTAAPRVCVWCGFEMQRTTLIAGARQITQANTLVGHQDFHHVHIGTRLGRATHLGMMCGCCKAKGYPSKLEINHATYLHHWMNLTQQAQTKATELETKIMKQGGA